jgi:hypothetical protein
MNLKHPLAIVLFISLLFSGCVSVSVANLQRTSSNEVEVFTTKIPGKEYTEIKYIQVDGSIFHRPEKLLGKLTERARNEGADAVIAVRYGYAVYLPYVSGTAIKYTSR